MQIPKPLPTPCISLVVGVDVVAHVVDDEVAEVGEEVIVCEVVAASSRASALPKNLDNVKALSKLSCSYDFFLSPATAHLSWSLYIDVLMQN